MEGNCYCLDTYRAGDLEGVANVNVVTCSRLKALVDGTDGRLLQGRPSGTYVLVPAVRYLAAHAPTMRAQG